jgi:predicted nucleic acid-binding protein
VTRYLLDTNVVSELLKVKPHGAVVAWLVKLRPEQIFIPAVTMAELQTGVELTSQQDANKAQEIQRWLDSLAVTFSFVPMDAACFQEWARMMTGKPDALRADAMIAATARVHGFEVATRNEADFRQFDVRIINPFKS